MCKKGLPSSPACQTPISTPQGKPLLFLWYPSRDILYIYKHIYTFLGVCFYFYTKCVVHCCRLIFFLIMALLRYKSHTTQLTHLKYNSVVLSIFRIVQASPQSILNHFRHPKKETPSPLGVFLHIPLTLPQSDLGDH